MAESTAPPTQEELAIIIDDPEEEETTKGPVNILEAQEYVEVMNKIFDDFNELVNEDRDDALITTLWSLKRHMFRAWGQMVVADVDMFIKSIKEPSFVMLHQALEERGVTMVDPEEDIPLGQEILRRLPPQKPARCEHCITLFDDLS